MANLNKNNQSISLSSLNSQIIELVENTAIACYPWIGKGDNHSADQEAVNSMRKSLNQMPISGKVVIGEGERDVTVKVSALRAVTETVAELVSE